MLVNDMHGLWTVMDLDRLGIGRDAHLKLPWQVEQVGMDDNVPRSSLQFLYSR